VPRPLILHHGLKHIFIVSRPLILHHGLRLGRHSSTRRGGAGVTVASTTSIVAGVPGDGHGRLVLARPWMRGDGVSEASEEKETEWTINFPLISGMMGNFGQLHRSMGFWSTPWGATENLWICPQDLDFWVLQISWSWGVARKMRSGVVFTGSGILGAVLNKPLDMVPCKQKRQRRKV
jgi:hypothetical protein